MDKELFFNAWRENTAKFLLLGLIKFNVKSFLAFV